MIIMEKQPIEVTKFGGALMGSAETVLSSVRSINNRMNSANHVIVVSAAQGVTDHLIELATSIDEKRFVDAKNSIDLFVDKQESIASTLPLDAHGRVIVANEIFNAAEHLQLHQHTSPLHPAMRDEILALGEYVSAHIFNETLRSTGINAKRKDAYELIRTDSSFGNASADVPQSEKLIKKHVLPMLERGEVVIIPGFYGVDAQGRTATMPRNSSDYSAGIVAYALDAKSLSLCKGIDGVYDRHPDLPGAVFLEYASYEDALLLSLNGGKVVYPETMFLLQQSQIPIYVFGLENPDRKTIISDNPL